MSATTGSPRVPFDRPHFMRLPSTVLTFLLTLGLAASCARRSSPEGAPSRAPSTAPTLTGPPSASAPTPAATKESGEALYQRYCALCHGKDATGYAADNAPSLVTETFLESVDDAFIASAIRLGRPATAMGAYGKVRGGPLDDADIARLVGFLRQKGPPAHPLPKSSVQGNAELGRAVYAAECETCHGTETERKTALTLYNPEFLRAASPDFLRFAIVHGRPPTPMPSFAEKLNPGQIEDVIAWLRSKAPGSADAHPTAPTIPANLPIVINPKGTAPKFTMRDDRYVPAAEVKKALDQRRRMVIIDARSPADWELFHIPGAISVPYYAAEQLSRIPNDGTWVIAYCACPHHASGEVVSALRSRGYKHTAVLDEGILEWKTRGYPLTGTAK